MSLQACIRPLGFWALWQRSALFAILLVRRQYRTFPVFTLYIAFNLLY